MNPCVAWRENGWHDLLKLSNHVGRDANPGFSLLRNAGIGIPPYKCSSRSVRVPD